MSESYSIKPTSGATLVEIAIFMPVFLLLIGSVYLISIYLNASTALSSSMATAVRLAITRGNPTLMGQDYNSGSLQTIETFIDSVTGEFPSDKLSMIASDEFTPDEAIDYYNDKVSFVFSGVALRELPKEYIYSLIFAIQSMKLNVGSLRYPCDANPQTNPTDFAGCFQCYFLNPDTGQFTEDFDSCATLGPDCVPRDRMAFYCEYAPDSPLISMIAGIFNFLSIGAPPQLRITRQVFYNLKESEE